MAKSVLKAILGVTCAARRYVSAWDSLGLMGRRSIYRGVAHCEQHVAQVPDVSPVLLGYNSTDAFPVDPLEDLAYMSRKS